MILIIVTIAIIVSFIMFAYRAFISRIMKEKNAQHEAEVLHQKKLVLENIKAQEEERKRIAVMIHDDIGNRLNILSLWLNNLDTKGDEVIKKISTVRCLHWLMLPEVFPTHYILLIWNRWGWFCIQRSSLRIFPIRLIFPAGNARI